jgi:arsenate reductase
MDQVQIFGNKKNANLRKALRFFSERRVQIHFVDFKIRTPSPGELRRFVQKFGAEDLIDRDSRRFAELGLRAANYSDDRWVEKLAEEPGILMQPLVRCGAQLTVGLAEKEWKTWS